MTEVKRISLGEGIPDIIVDNRGEGLVLLKIPVKIPTQYMYRRLKIDNKEVEDYLSNYKSEDIWEIVSGDSKFLEVP